MANKFKDLAAQVDVQRVERLMTNIPDAVFVFGSNLAGVHGAGAAQAAVRQYGAVIGKGIGLQGRAYAVPTKDHRLRTLPLVTIKTFVDQFLDFAEDHGELAFAVTRIGCGLAGYTDSNIAPLFKAAPPNCDLPIGWRSVNYECAICFAPLVEVGFGSDGYAWCPQCQTEPPHE